MNIGVNTFGLGKYLHKDPEAVWNGLLKAGAGSIEPCIAFRPIPRVTRLFRKGLFDGIFDKEKAFEIIMDLRDRGFEVFSFQLQSVPFTIEALNEVLPFMEKTGLEYCVYSFMDGSVSNIKSRAAAIREAVSLFSQSGRKLLIHNHDMEWRSDDGTSVMQWLLDNIPELGFEIDLGWTEYAGVDSVGILHGYPGRFPLLHIKDIAKGVKAGTGRPFCTAPGQGVLPLKEIIDEVKNMPLSDRALIIDQDDSIGNDIVADIEKGIQTIKLLYL